MSKNPWKEFEDESYRLEDLGRAATFLLPSHKLRMDFGDSTVEKVLENFLFDNFYAFTTTTFPSAGLWRNNENKVFYDECKRYEVSFAGKEKIPIIIKKLAEICKHIEEECLYFTAGQYVCIIYPN